MLQGEVSDCNREDVDWDGGCGEVGDEGESPPGFFFFASTLLRFILKRRRASGWDLSVGGPSANAGFAVSIFFSGLP